MPKAINLLGQKFGRLMVMRLDISSKIRKWVCLCDCGSEISIKTSSLRAGYNKNCGKKKCKGRHSNSISFKNLIGQSFGNLLCIRKDSIRKKRKDGKYSTLFVFRCKCGNERSFSPCVVRRESISSCGKCKPMTNNKIKERLTTSEALYGQVISEYKSNAKKRNLEFSLSYDLCVNLLSSNCFYCGDIPSRIKNDKCGLNRKLVVTGIDRLDSSRGYTVDNIVSCCFTCNKIKSDTLYNDFYKYIIKVHSNLKKNGAI